MAVTRSTDGESRARGAAIQHAGEQGLLFGDEELATHSDDVGYRGPTACAAAGITYRQLDYWARTKLVVPSVRAAHGSGSQRLYSFRDICVLKVVKRLLDTGISLQQIRPNGRRSQTSSTPATAATSSPRGGPCAAAGSGEPRLSMAVPGPVCG